MTRAALSQTAPIDLVTQWRVALENRSGAPVEDDPVACALLNFLDAHGWQGSPRKLVEAMPATEGPLDFEAMRNVLARLKIGTVATNLSPKSVPETLCPCLVKTGLSKAPTVLIGRESRHVWRRAKKAAVGETEIVRRIGGGTVFVTDPVVEDQVQGAEGARRWFRGLGDEFRGAIMITALLAFFINVMAMIVPLAIMVIYDQVIAKEATETLEWLMLGIAGATVFEILLKICRAKLQAFIGAKLDYRVATKVFEQVLHLPPLFTERAPVGGQVSRLREFDGFRDLFAGPMVGTLIDLPFTLIFLLVLYLIGGPIVAIPIVLAVVYLILARIVLPATRMRAGDAGRARNARYGFLVELVDGIRSIKQQDGTGIWRSRFGARSADASWASYESNKLQANTVALSQSIMMASGAITLGVGVVLVIENAMTMGALIATMMLVWRVLGPLQTLLSLAHRWEQTRDVFGQVVDLLAFRKEQQPGGDPDVPIKFQGHLRFNRVSMRYGNDGNPALLGVGIDIRAGELIGVAGESGAGKSTVAKVAMGLYQPQAGAVTLDGIDLRQLRPITLRQNLAYVPQRNHLFPGSLRDNITLADPTASEERVRHACKMAGILHKVDGLPNGLDTVFREGPQNQLPGGFLRQIALARAFLRDAPVYVLDEPTSSMDEDDERFFLRSLEVLRGRATVLLVTQRPSHMRLCDRLVYMEDGQVRFFDEPERVLDALQASNAGMTGNAKTPATVAG
jgi:ATP-binding cassette subfamily C protein LapB